MLTGASKKEEKREMAIGKGKRKEKTARQIGLHFFGFTEWI